LGYFHYDAQGNVASVTDESRAEVAYYEYDAWGNLLTSCGALANDFKFSTKQASTGTGLVDFGYRWYDPQTARCTQRDPLGAIGGLNLYGYVKNDPANRSDPHGLSGDAWMWDAYADGGPEGNIMLIEDAAFVVRGEGSEDLANALLNPREELERKVGELCEEICQGTKEWWDSWVQFHQEYGWENLAIALFGEATRQGPHRTDLSEECLHW